MIKIKAQFIFVNVLKTGKQVKMANNDLDISSAYNEKIWGKGIADGYVFRGKKIFEKAVEGLRKLMTKGAQGVINGIEFQSLDTRLIGTELTIDVRIKDGNQSGIGLLKLYDTNNKKENVVMVSKSKQGGHEFVTMLAEKVIKPLMEKFMLDKNVSDCTEEQVGLKENFKCEKCGKVLFSSRGLKGHITKMHGIMNKKLESKKNNKRKTEELSDNDVRNKVKEVIEISDDDNSNDESEEKKYTNACDSCDFKTETNRKYLSLQHIRKHKEQCSNRKSECVQCGKRFKSFQEMKRHSRDEHGHVTGSTSPPKKKKRQQIKLNFEEDEKEMEIDEEEEEVKDISIKLEDMEIEHKMEEDEAIIFAERSKLMDEKVKAKQKRIEDEEKLQRERKEIHEKDLEREKKEIKAIKQKTKNFNKKKKKKESQAKKVEFAVPNLKEVPLNCKRFVEDNDVIYQVPGDGACGPNTAAAHLFKDEVFGPKLRKNMNIYFADHYYRKYHTISPCSPENPFIRRCKGKIIKFTNPEELIKFLKTSEEAKYMWSDGEDFAVIADMYQIRIKIITTKGLNDENPSVNWIIPDKELKDFAEIKDVEIDDMVVIHTDDVHFDLVVDRNSDLATMGSLSYRHNIGPMVKENEENKNQIEKPNSDTEKDIEILRKKLKTCEKSKEILEKQYKECEADLRKMTEEVEKLKIENNNLKEMRKLEKEIRDKHVEIDSSDNELEEEVTAVKISESKPSIQTKTPQFKYRPKFRSEEEEFNCHECDYQGTRQNELQKHMKLKHENQEVRSHTTGENNCNKCDKIETKEVLQKHTDLQHTSKDLINCRICGAEFLTKGNLMYHRKREHPMSVATCRNKLTGQCRRSDDTCWWSHEQRIEGNNTCFICEKTFRNKNEMMIHRKSEHANIVQDCQEFKKQQCRFNEDFCWFKHTVKEIEVEQMDTESKQVFQKVMENLKPPYQETSQ